MRRLLPILVLLGAFVAPAELLNAAGAAPAGAATTCKTVAVVHRGTRLVFKWRIEHVKVGKRTETKKVHVWRTEKVKVHGKLVEKKIPVKVRKVYETTSHEQQCSTTTTITTTTTPTNPTPAAQTLTAPVTTPTTTPASPVVTYSASVDPTFTQAPTNPLAVTYSYSADATEATGSDQVDLGATGQLPSGILDLYSATSPGGSSGLICSMNVGESTTGGTCPVTYSDTGTYGVTTEYFPEGEAPVTSTEAETISPYSTTTALGTITQSHSTEACGTVSDPQVLDIWTVTVPSTTTDQDDNVLPESDATYFVTYYNFSGGIVGTATVGAMFGVPEECGAVPIGSVSIQAIWGPETGYTASTSAPVTVSFTT